MNDIILEKQTELTAIMERDFADVQAHFKALEIRLTELGQIVLSGKGEVEITLTAIPNRETNKLEWLDECGTVHFTENMPEPVPQADLFTPDNSKGDNSKTIGDNSTAIPEVLPNQVYVPEILCVRIGCSFRPVPEQIGNSEKIENEQIVVLLNMQAGVVGDEARNALNEHCPVWLVYTGEPGLFSVSIKKPKSGDWVQKAI